MEFNQVEVTLARSFGSKSYSLVNLLFLKPGIIVLLPFTHVVLETGLSLPSVSTGHVRFSDDLPLIGIASSF